MKRILFFAFLLLSLASSALAQVPQGIPYQAAARNASGQPLVNTAVKVRFSIIDSVATGTTVYQETHSVTTNNVGLFNVNVGLGTPVIGTFSGINWGKNFKFMKVELDPSGAGSNYVDMGTQQMMSVPYALYAGTSSISNSLSSIGVSNIQAPIVNLDENTLQNVLGNQIGFYWSVVSGLGNAIIRHGVCWATHPSPTVTDSVKNLGSGVKGYHTNISGLNYYTTYYVRAFAENSKGVIGYSNEIALTTPPLVGTTFKGGIIAYVLVPGDLGYDTLVPHGIIAAPNDLISASFGCNTLNVNTSSALLAGASNTTNIVNVCTTANIAADLCYNYSINNYSDWSLPSNDDWSKITYKEVTFPTLTAKMNLLNILFSNYYWSSTQSSVSTAVGWYMASNGCAPSTNLNKSLIYKVRPVRYF